jgi:hypothetical protein
MANAVTRIPNSVARGSTMLSVTIDTFGGLNQVNREQFLQLGELVVARNVEVTRNGKIKRRSGYTSLASGNWHSLYYDGETALGVCNNNLVEIDVNWDTTILLSGIGKYPVSYVTVNGIIYLTNDHIIGKVSNSAYSSLSSATIWDLKNRLIPGHLIEYFNGRLCVAKDNIMFFSDVGHYQEFDYKTNFKQLPSRFQMMKAVDHGIYVSDKDRSYFMAGDQPAKFKLEKLFDSPAILGTEVSLDAAMTKEGYMATTYKQSNKGRAVVWTSKDGICIGLGDGVAANKTFLNYEMPSGISGGSAVVIKDNDTGSFKYVASIW